MEAVQEDEPSKFRELWQRSAEQREELPELRDVASVEERAPGGSLGLPGS